MSRLRSCKSDRLLAAGGILSLVLSLPAACDAGSSGASDPGGIEAATSASRRTTLLRKIQDAPLEVRYSGVRRVRVDYAIAGVPTTLEYDENVYSDGRGAYAIVPGDVISPSMTREQLELFALLQSSRDGFLYLHRDFRIRDLRIFLQTWTVAETGVAEVVAGVPCSLFEFHRIDQASVWYRAWIDPVTGLVLRAHEIDDQGGILSRVEFLEFDPDPDLSGIDLHGDRQVRTPLDPGSDTSMTIGFDVRTPSLLPAGYRLDRAESTSDGTHTWAILTYTDGIDEVFFLPTLGGENNGTPPVQAGVDVGPTVVRGYRVGPWTVLQGEFYSVVATVLGKAGEASLVEMLRSALP